jgi:phi13 family phage major tail protein
MSTNADEYKSVVGVSDLYYALVTADSASAYTAGTPKVLAPAAEVNQEPKVNSSTQYADNKPYDALVSEAETTIKMKVTDIPNEALAEITGKAWDSTTGRLIDQLGTPPYCALGFKAKKSNGKYKWIWFLKGRFTAPNENAATQTDSMEPQPMELEFTAIKTTYAGFSLPGSVTDGAKKVVGDDDSTNFSGTGWFTQVQVPGVATASALALSGSSPAANATGVVVSVDITLTFNNALMAGEEADITLVTAAGASVASAITIDAARKVVTINPTSSMTGATVHIVTYTVKDVYGQVLAGVFKFTTA